MSKSLIARLSALEALHEGQESPKPAIVAIRGIDGVKVNTWMADQYRQQQRQKTASAG